MGIKAYILNIHFQKNLGIAIIGQNFFTEFHTLFDSENNVLKFYSDNKDKIINIKKYNNKKNDNYEEEGSSTLKVLFVIIVILLIIGYLYYRNKNKKMMENENQFQWMGQNNGTSSKYNNINSYNAMV